MEARVEALSLIVCNIAHPEERLENLVNHKHALSVTDRLVSEAEAQAELQNNRMSILVAVGTRPEAIKMIPVVRALQGSGEFFPVVISTGQHEDLVAELFRDAGLHIDVNLRAARKVEGAAPTLNEMVARIIVGIDELWNQQQIPEGMGADGIRGPRGAIACLVHGDTSSAAAAALASFNLQIPVVHVEAGLRTANLMEPFPEEGNRQIISRLAAVHFAPTSANKANLIREGVDFDRIVVTGNTSIDMMRLAIEGDGDLGLGLEEVYEDPNRRVVLVTAHRRENWGRGLEQIACAIAELASLYPSTAFVIPMHPNPIARKPLLEKLSAIENAYLVEPREYFTFMRLIARSCLIITDSGGIQEEAPSLGIPVLVARGATERSEGVKAGTLRLVGTDPDLIVSEASLVLNRSDTELAKAREAAPQNPYGDGRAAERIVQALTQVRWGGPMPDLFEGETLRQAVFRHMGRSDVLQPKGSSH